MALILRSLCVNEIYTILKCAMVKSVEKQKLRHNNFFEQVCGFINFLEASFSLFLEPLDNSFLFHLLVDVFLTLDQTTRSFHHC